MANVTVAGASFADVPAVALPTTGGGTSTFYEVSGSQTITENGTFDVTTLAEAVVNVAGGGGASNTVTGTFKGTTTGAMDVALNYTGSGYPIAAVVFPEEGPYNSGSGSFYNLLQRYACAFFCMIKQQTNTTPTYSGSGAENSTAGYNRYKNSASTATTYTGSAFDLANTFTFTSAAASNSNNRILTINSPTKMSVRIATSSYCFAANITYRYCVLYSS